MNSLNYNYYGKTDNTRSFLDVSVIQKKQLAREKRRLKLYEIIALKCFNKISEEAAMESTFLFFQIPEFVTGLPIYDTLEAAEYLITVLQKKGYSSKYCGDSVLFITWTFYRKNYAALLEGSSHHHHHNNHQSSNSENSLLNNLNLNYKNNEITNYRPIETYKSSNSLLYNGNNRR